MQSDIEGFFFLIIIIKVITTNYHQLLFKYLVGSFHKGKIIFKVFNNNSNAAWGKFFIISLIPFCGSPSKLSHLNATSGDHNLRFIIRLIVVNNSVNGIGNLKYKFTLISFILNDFFTGGR